MKNGEELKSLHKIVLYYDAEYCECMCKATVAEHMCERNCMEVRGQFWAVRYLPQPLRSPGELELKLPGLHGKHLYQLNCLTDQTGWF